MPNQLINKTIPSNRQKQLELYKKIKLFLFKNHMQTNQNQTTPSANHNFRYNPP